VSSSTAISGAPVTATRTASSRSTAPYAGKVVVPEGAAHGYELVEQLTVLPQRRPHDGMLGGLQSISGDSTVSEWQPSDWGADQALAQRWLDAGASSSIEGFCAAAYPQLGSSASALVEVLAGLPMRVGQDARTAAKNAIPLAAAAEDHHREHSNSYAASHSQEGQDLHDYSLQDSFARGHFGEGQATMDWSSYTQWQSA
jgi:hypothetical protein